MLGPSCAPVSSHNKVVVAGCQGPDLPPCSTCCCEASQPDIPHLIGLIPALVVLCSMWSPSRFLASDTPALSSCMQLAAPRPDYFAQISAPPLNPSLAVEHEMDALALTTAGVQWSSASKQPALSGSQPQPHSQNLILEKLHANQFHALANTRVPGGAHIHPGLVVGSPGCKREATTSSGTAGERTRPPDELRRSKAFRLLRLLPLP